MARYIVQSQVTGRFLVPSLDGLGEPFWTRSLREAGAGVVTDPELAGSLLGDTCDSDDRAVIIDLDRLGTANDYT
jgi:glycerol kinase